ncbi:MAG: AsmA-like C-terminal region-containing protein, partial [Balneolales bacterium]
MKIFLWIAGVITGLLVMTLIALNIYFTDARLKSMIMPQLEETAGREIMVESMSLTFFRTFPNFGVLADQILVPDDQGGTLASLEQMVIAVNIIPYLTSNEIHLSRLDLKRPEMTYIVYEDGSTNTDELLAYLDSEEEEAAGESMAVELSHMFISNARLTYDDKQAGNLVVLGGLDAHTALRFATQLETSLSVDIRNLTVTRQGEELVSGLQLSLETATGIDFDNEVVTMDSGSLNLSGLALTLSGTVSQWSAENLLVDLIFASESEDFEALLDLVPEAYEEQFEGVETSGSLSIAGTISGQAGAAVTPAFQFVVTVDEGYLKYPDVEDAIEQITLHIEATNDLIHVQRFGALAGTNQVSAFGEIRQPLGDRSRFALNMDLDVNLETVQNFYPLGEEGLELSGLLNMSAVGEGFLADFENATFDAEVNLAEGLVKLAGVEEPVRDINVAMLVSQSLAEIESFSARAAGNELDIRGTIHDPLSEDQANFDLFGNLELDLSTVERFYPIDEDTLLVRGLLTASGTANGRINDAENAETDLRVVLTGGYLHHRDLAHPFENVEFESAINHNFMDINQLSLQSGNNSLTASGRINGYRGDNPDVNMRMESSVDLAQAADYFEYPLTMSGNLVADLHVNGSVTYPEELILTGSADLGNAGFSGEDLPAPIRDLNAILTFQDQQADLKEFTMFMGESDFQLNATLRNYMALTAETGQAEPAILSGTYYSRKLNLDELSDADAADEPFPIELPNLITRLTATVDTLVFMEMTATSINGQAESDPGSIRMPEGSLNMFGGTISGSFIWDIPDPEHTNITFQGNLADLRVENFFEQFQLGGQLRLNEYASGNFNAETDYYTELDVYLKPIISSTRASGFFGMDEANLQDHPLQAGISSLLNMEEFQDLSLEEWTANYTIDESILTLENMNITSGDIGLTMNGTQNLMADEINYSARVSL